jgi:hypothetical protein
MSLRCTVIRTQKVTTTKLAYQLYFKNEQLFPWDETILVSFSFLANFLFIYFERLARINIRTQSKSLVINPVLCQEVAGVIFSTSLMHTSTAHDWCRSNSFQKKIHDDCITDIFKWKNLSKLLIKAYSKKKKKSENNRIRDQYVA